MSETHDDHVYSWILFNRETVEFMGRAIDFYLSLLQDESKQLEAVPELAALITPDTRRELGLGRDKQRTERLKEWLTEELKKRGDAYDMSLTLSHWLVRFLKSVSLLYLSKLKISRNTLASQPNVTATTLSAVDREITAKEELFNFSGVFKDASPIKLLAEVGEPLPTGTAPGGQDSSLLRVERPRPVLVASIEILDHELRSRCLDLFNQFQEAGQAERNDTVVSEATRVLENRLRRVVEMPDGTAVKALVKTAFHPDNPKLRVSTVWAEQEAVQLLFLGAFGFVRNQVQHKLLGNLPPERVLQVLGWVDYLLSVIAQAEVVKNAP